MRRYADQVPIVLLILGFLMIGIGWNGAAGIDFTQGQIPYLISGGLVGLAFVLFGCTSLIIRAIKRAQSQQLEQLEILNTNMQRVASALSWGTNGNGANSTNGQHDKDLVIVGAASFHLEGCRLVGTARALTKVPRAEAESEGLQPCRVCKP
ncbi:MAG: hypothetical protein ABR507_07050 [Actinomycetota bacterium]|nr:hypothetical protein [Actinomycetota bacterium]